MKKKVRKAIYILLCFCVFTPSGVASPDRRGEEDIAGTGGDQQAEKRRFRGC